MQGMAIGHCVWSGICVHPCAVHTGAAVQVNASATQVDTCVTTSSDEHIGVVQTSPSSSPGRGVYTHLFVAVLQVSLVQRSASPQSAATRQSTQAFVAVSHLLSAGLVVHPVSSRQSTQSCVAVLQTLRIDEESQPALLMQSSQLFMLAMPATTKHWLFVPLQPALLPSQTMQLLVAPSHTGRAPAHAERPPVRHGTQAPVVVLQAGVEPPHCASDVQR